MNKVINTTQILVKRRKERIRQNSLFFFCFFMLDFSKNLFLGNRKDVIFTCLIFFIYYPAIRNHLCYFTHNLEQKPTKNNVHSKVTYYKITVSKGFPFFNPYFLFNFLEFFFSSLIRLRCPYNKVLWFKRNNVCVLDVQSLLTFYAPTLVDFGLLRAGIKYSPCSRSTSGQKFLQ